MNFAKGTRPSADKKGKMKMKSIIVSAMVAGAAMFANAAAVDWTASAVVDPVATASAGKNTPASGWLGYLIMASDLSTITADLTNGDTSSLLASAIGAVKTSNTKGAFTASTAVGDIAAGSQEFYMIVLNAGSAAEAKSFYVSNKTTADVDASLDTEIKFGSQAANSKLASNWTAIGVPEPTSGLLMLVGLAGLALRRRRA